MNAAPQAQQRLLDLQALDSTADRLEHRRRTLPERERLAELERAEAEVADRLGTARTEDADLGREQAKLEGDVDQVRSRADRDRQRLDAGSVGTARELEGLQSELASLGRRQDDLEEQVLALMLRREELQRECDQLAGELAELTRRRAAAAEEMAGALEGIAAESGAVAADRRRVAADLPADLLALYERVRADRGGVGAAALYRGRCEGCHLTLSGSDLAGIRAAPADAVLRCEECRRILVRTPESGL